MYIGGLTQASLKEVMRDKFRPERKSGESHYHCTGNARTAFEGEERGMCLLS
jgi:hypothetical protein